MNLPCTPSTRLGSRAAPTLITIALLSMGFSTVARPASFDNRPKLLLHTQGVVSKNPCLAVSISNCADAVTQADLITGASNYQYVYILTGKGDMPDVTGLAFGISYQDNCPDNDQDDLAGVDIFSWTLCATLDLQSASPAWPKPYSGTLITWDAPSRCQTGDIGVAGYFYCGAYTNDVLQIIARPADGLARMVTCAGTERNLDAEDLGFVAFSSGGASPGCNPCDGPCPGPLIPPPAPPCVPAPPPPPPPPGSAAILVHVTPVATQNACSVGELANCSDAVVKGGLSEPVAGPFYFLHLLVNRGDLPDVGGIQCGITYDNNLPGGASNNSRIDVLSWKHCAALEFRMPSPPWPGPGSGNLIVWDRTNDCQTGYTAVAGYFYIAAYSADIFRVTPRPVDGEAKIGGCLATETLIPESQLGYAAFSAGATTEGCNPCFTDCAQAVPVQQTTWSGVKTLLR